jgi:hypothetical protein
MAPAKKWDLAPFATSIGGLVRSLALNERVEGFGCRDGEGVHVKARSKVACYG